MSNFIDLTGQKFGRLTVINRVANSKSGKTMWFCNCICGNSCIVYSGNLRGGQTKSCGCIHKEKFNHTIHGKRHSKLYLKWQNIKKRCLNPNAANYKNYGGRENNPVTVYSEWANSFKAFYDWSINNGYKDGLSIDRIDNNKGYSPQNCRWVTLKEQANNKTTNKMIDYKEKTQSLSNWANELEMDYSLLYLRLKRGWPIEKAFSTPKNK